MKKPPGTPKRTPRKFLRRMQDLHQPSVIDRNLDETKSLTDIMHDPNPALVTFYFEKIRRDNARERGEALCKNSYEQGNVQALFDYVAGAREKALTKAWVQEEIRKWQEIVSPDNRHVTKTEREQARKNLYKIGAAFAIVSGSGRVKARTEQQEEAIAADCQKWHPVCRQLKKDLSGLRQKSEWASEWFRKGALGKLAEKYSLSRSEVTEIEDLAPHLTPWQMTMRLVARRHTDEKGFMRGEKTIEEIYREWRKKPPE